MRIILLLIAAALWTGCNSRNPQLAEDPRSAVAITGGPNTSMIYVARTDSGVIAIDLGWWGHGQPMSRALARIGATESDVKHVFITHSHRDHIAAWPSVQRARFHLAADELPRFVGTASHRGWMVRWGEWLNATHLPNPGQVDARPFSSDTVFLLGSDTLRAYIVPGHTAGSAAYLFRSVLFMGDAITYYPFRGFRPAKAQFSDDAGVAIASLAALWPRIPLGEVRVICTAHGECVPLAPGVLDHIGGERRPE